VVLYEPIKIEKKWTPRLVDETRLFSFSNGPFYVSCTATRRNKPVGRGPAHALRTANQKWVMLPLSPISAKILRRFVSPSISFTRLPRWITCSSHPDRLHAT